MAVKQHVFEFQVTVHDSLGMHVADSLNDLPEQAFNFILVYDALSWVFPNVLVQIGAVYVLNHQVDLVWTLKRVVKLHDARVRQLSKNFRFSLKGINPRHVLEQLLNIVLLDGDLVAFILMSGSFDLRACSLPNQHIDVVISDLGFVQAGYQLHGAFEEVAIA